MVLVELEVIIKVESVIELIAGEVTKRMTSRNNVIIYYIPDKMAHKSVRNLILKAANLQHSPCQYICLIKKHQKFSRPILFRFDSHLLAEWLKKSKRLSVRDRIVSDKTANQRLMRQCALNEKNDVEIKTDPIVSAAGPTGTTNLSYVSQYSDLSMKKDNSLLK